MFALSGAALLAGCGFRPLYRKADPEAGRDSSLADIRILNVKTNRRQDDRLGQKMHNLLLDRLNPSGRPTRPLYSLETTLTVSRERTGIEITEEATRARLTVSTSFVLRNTRGGKPLLTGTERSVNSYNIVDSEFASLSAENDAAERAVREISDSIRLRLTVFFQRPRNGADFDDRRTGPRQ